MRLTLLLLVVACGWPASHLTLGVTATGAIVADCVTTEAMLDSPFNYEKNPLLGKRPSDFKLWTMCGAGVAATWVVADALPEARVPLLATISIVELAFAGHNAGWWRLW